MSRILYRWRALNHFNDFPVQLFSVDMMKACRGVTVQLIDPQGFIVNLAGNFVLIDYTSKTRRLPRLVLPDDTTLNTDPDPPPRDSHSPTNGVPD